jgi:hypothetical protein
VSLSNGGFALAVNKGTGMQDFNRPPEENENDEDAANDPAASSDDPFFAPPPKAPASKYSIMGFGGIVVVLGVFCFLHFRGPSSATAAATPTIQANQTIAQFLSAGTNDIHDMETSLQNTQKQVRIFENYPSAKQVPLGNLKTNPFAYRPGDQSAADIARKKAEQQAEIEKAAQDLKLQSIMYSSNPHGHSQCMINYSLCNTGGQIGGFTIIKINPNSIVLKQGLLQFELKIQK